MDLKNYKIPSSQLVHFRPKIEPEFSRL